MSQSGALCTSVLDTAAAAAVGFSRFVSLGNKLDVNESDLLAAWEHDPHVRVIAAYLEGIVDGKRFMRVASRVTKAKPVVMIKSGTTAAGIKAVSSHTGTLAGADHAYDAVLRQSGVLRVETVQDMFDVMTAFEHQPLPPAGDPGVCVITNAGGPGIMASDALERAGLTLAALSPATQEKLRRGLPPSASAANPVDVLGDAGADRYAHALDCVMEDPCVGAVLVVLTPQMMTRPKETAAAVAAAAARSGKTMLGVLMGDEAVAEGEHILHINGVPNYPVPERAVKALAAMARQRRWQDRPAAAPKRFSSVDAAAVADVFRRVRADGRSVAGDAESVAIKAAYGIPSPETANAANANEAVAAADRMGYPVVLKVSSPDILHKTDVGGVALGLGSAQAVREAFESIVAKAQKALEPVPGGGRIWGCMVQKQAPKGAKELLLGVKRDAQFGHLVVFGLGGIYVEALKDVTFRVAPVDRAQAYEMLDEIRAAPLLRGVRSEPPVDREAVVDAILRLSQLVVDFPEIIEEADINPLLAFDKGAQAIDMRVILGPATADGGSAAKKRSL